MLGSSELQARIGRHPVLAVEGKLISEPLEGERRLD
jgi:hypothetical protein